jgi:hypothetical protein
MAVGGRVRRILTPLAPVAMAAAIGVGCGDDRGPTPVRPERQLTPTTVGVLATFDFVTGSPGRFHLEDGQVIDMPTFAQDGTILARNLEGGAFTAPSGTDAGKPWPGGGPVMLFGADDAGPWYVEAQLRFGDRTCYLVSGGAFVDGPTMLFESGLVVPLAATFHVEPDWIKEPFPLRRNDDICLDREGRVATARVRPSL